MDWLNEKFKIEIFKKVGDVLKESSFNKNEPIPIAAVFYDIDNMKIIGLTKNEMSVGLKSGDKYLKHAEYLAIKSEMLVDYNNVGVLITIPPCKDCYKTLVESHNINHISWITHKHGVHKIFKIRKLIDDGIRSIPFEKITMITEDERDCYEQYKNQIKNIEKWMRNS